MLAATSAVITSALVTAPAHALSLFGNFSFTGNVKITGDSSNYKFDFLSSGSAPAASPGTTGNITIGAGTGSFAGASEGAGGAKINDFSTDVSTTNFPKAPLTNFITGIKLADGTDLSFDLSEFNDFTAVFLGGTVNGGNLVGSFRNTANNSVVSSGFLTAQFPNPDKFTGVTTYSASLRTQEVPTQEIPTPALLPGLVGMGVAALRKHRSDTDQSVEA